MLHQCQGFDVLEVADIGKLFIPGSYFSFPHDLAISSSYGRGARGIRIAGLDSIGVMFLSPVTSFVHQFAVRQIAQAGGQWGMCKVMDVNTDTGHLSLVFNADGSVSVYHGSILTGGFHDPELGRSVIGKWRPDTWLYVEWKAVLHATAGSVVVRLNGETILNISGVGTLWGSPSPSISTATAIFMNGWSYTDYDDIILMDQTGSRLNDFLGDRIVEDQLPSSGNGVHTEWTPSSGTDHGAMVDESPIDGDTTYNASTVVGQRDTYAFPATSRLTSVDAVQVNQFLRKTSFATRAVKLLTRSGGSDYLNATEWFLGYGGYVGYAAMLETNPNTSSPWTLAQVAAAEHGPQVTT